MNRPPEDPLAPIVRGLLVALAVVIVIMSLSLTGCAVPPAATPAAKPAFPEDMQIVCFRGEYYLGSVSADSVVRLPIRCTST